MNKKKLNSDKINDKTNVIKPMSKKILIMKKESLWNMMMKNLKVKKLLSKVISKSCIKNTFYNDSWIFNNETFAYKI